MLSVKKNLDFYLGECDYLKNFNTARQSTSQNSGQSLLTLLKVTFNYGKLKTYR